MRCIVLYQIQIKKSLVISGSKIRKDVAVIATAKKKKCTCCGKELPLINFYMSHSPMFALDKKINICKDCFGKSSVDPDTGEVDIEKFKAVLRQADKPFYLDNLQSSINQYQKEHSDVPTDEVKYHGEGIIKLYMKNTNTLRQLSHKTYADSESDGFVQKNSTVLKKTGDKTNHSLKKITKQKSDDEVIILDEEEFEVTKDMIDLFGEGYTRLEYKKMVKKYKEMSETYVIQTSIHKEALVTYVRFKVKEELATARGDVVEAQKWYTAAQNAAEQGKLTAKSISKEDLQGGLVNFSDIFKMVEGTKERIKIFPEFKYQPKDAADFIIWCYINYERNLNNMPEVPYKDIYHFYDEKKKEYVAMYGDPYGIFVDDPTEDNRPTIEKFITIPPEFRVDE